MYVKKLALAALLAATATGYAAAADLPVKAAKAAPAIPFFLVNDNSLTASWSPTATDPGAGKVGKYDLVFVHFDVWAYGTNFLAADLTTYGTSDSANQVFAGQANSPASEFYGLFRSTFGWNEIFNTKAFAIGPLTNISFEVGADGETENAQIHARKRDVVAGLNFTFMLPYKGNLSISPLYYKEWNHNQFVATATNAGNMDFNGTWAVETGYAIPLGFLPSYVPLTFGGSANWYGPKGTGNAGTLAQTKTESKYENHLTLDVGKLLWAKPGMLSTFVGYTYWVNKYGIDINDPAQIAAGGANGAKESTWTVGTTVAF
ncbi:MAG TPA: hypothetical protein VGC38_04005 [Pseudolabrys sp.]